MASCKSVPRFGASNCKVGAQMKARFDARRRPEIQGFGSVVEVAHGFWHHRDE